MTEPSVLPEEFEGTPRRSHRRKARVPGCIPVLIVFALVIGAGYYFVPRAIDSVRDRFEGPEDYPGPGTGEVAVEINEGQTIASMGEELTDLGVVASSEAFVDAAAEHSEATRIQAGTYLLKSEMKASDALDILVDPANISQTTVTIPEGLWVTDVLKILTESGSRAGDFTRQDYQAVLNQPATIGLPPYAKGNPEGYLFPATYEFRPSDTPQTILKAMVDRWRQESATLQIDTRAKQLGYTPHQLMTVASLVQSEGIGLDMGKIARVIYNRTENPGTAGTAGFLQLDATVDYARGKHNARLTYDQILATRSPYNTYTHQGLPPGPIAAPGKEALEAALKPTPGNWYYYVTVNLDTGETKFAKTPAEFARYKAELDAYCDKSDRC